MNTNTYYNDYCYINSTGESLKDLSEEIFYAAQENMINKYYDESDSYEFTRYFY